MRMPYEDAVPAGSVLVIRFAGRIDRRKTSGTTTRFRASVPTAIRFCRSGSRPRKRKMIPKQFSSVTKSREPALKAATRLTASRTPTLALRCAVAACTNIVPVVPGNILAMVLCNCSSAAGEIA